MHAILFVAKLARKIFNLATRALQLRKERRGQRFSMVWEDSRREFVLTTIVRGKPATLASSTADSSRLGIRGTYIRDGLVRRGCLLGIQRCWRVATVKFRGKILGPCRREGGIFRR